MIDKVKSECTGCNACYSKCPVDAIRMEPDVEGFLRPVIDWHICTKCNLCEKVCPVLVPCKVLDTHPPKVFAAWSKDENLRISSTSGGVFSELAKKVLADGGYVFGARYRSDFTVEHHGIDDLSDLPLLRQSKYMQSEMGHTFREVEKQLGTGAPVLFCGTPCHAAGLLSYLGKAYENLTVCDFICRGVTSAAVFEAYLSDLEKQHESSVKTLQFKNKEIGWNQFCTRIEFEDGQVYLKDRNGDAYMRGYLKHNLYVRPSCYDCKFKEIPRVSDISLADFWGIGNTRPHLDDNKGTSMVMLNTGTAESLFAECRRFLEAEHCALEEAVAGNGCIFTNIAPPVVDRRFFFKHLPVDGFALALKKYERLANAFGMGSRLFRKAKRILSR